MASSTGCSTTGNAYNFKVVLLGEGCVGKTSVLLRYVEDMFNDKHLTTVQVELQNLGFFCILSLNRGVYCYRPPFLRKS